jgi:carbon monoxide dehydrogenase subunit G
LDIPRVLLQLLGCENQMAQMEVTASAVIGVPPAELWELISDTSRYAEWVAGTAEVTRTDGPASEGSTYDEINPIMGPWRAKTRWTVTEFDPPHRQVHRTEDVPFASEFLVIIDLAPSGDGSEVTVKLRANPSLGVLGASVLRILKSQTRKDNERTVKNLAKLATSGL